VGYDAGPLDNWFQTFREKVVVLSLEVEMFVLDVSAVEDYESVLSRKVGK
jgi:hypothetical protein